VLRPLKGGPQAKVQPIIRSVQNFGVTISPMSSDWHQLTNYDFFGNQSIAKQGILHPPPTAAGIRNSRAGHYATGSSSNDLINIYINPKGASRALKNYETIGSVLGKNHGHPKRTTSASSGRKHHNQSVSMGYAEKLDQNNPNNMSTIDPGVTDIVIGKNMKWANSDRKEAKKQQTGNKATRIKVGEGVSKQISFLFVKKPTAAIKLSRAPQPALRKNIFNFNIHA